MIHTRATKLRLSNDAENKEAIRRQLVLHGFPLITDWTPKGIVQARVYAGYWCADCPTPSCGGNEFVDPAWPLFVCTGGCGCGPLEVMFPKARKQIEAVLNARPVIATRNWFPSESLADLKAENKEHSL